MCTCPIVGFLEYLLQQEDLQVSATHNMNQINLFWVCLNGNYGTIGLTQYMKNLFYGTCALFIIIRIQVIVSWVIIGFDIENGYLFCVCIDFIKSVCPNTRLNRF